MADQFVAEIRIFPFTFAPTGWAFCSGQLLPISQNTALFSLLGTTYGGNGMSNFALPDMQGHAPMHPGQGPGLSLHDLGESSGSETVTLLSSEMPSHGHGLGAQNIPLGSVASPAGATLDHPASGNLFYGGASPFPVAMAPEALAPAGSGLPHNNMQPYLTLNFCIALQGIFPPRTVSQGKSSPRDGKGPARRASMKGETP
jgi:microcystin-dependent protein